MLTGSSWGEMVGVVVYGSTLSNKTIAMFGSFVLYAIYTVRTWKLHLALVRQNNVDMIGFLLHLWSCDLVQGL